MNIFKTILRTVLKMKVQNDKRLNLDLFMKDCVVGSLSLK